MMPRNISRVPPRKLTIGAICTAGVLSRIDYRIGVIGGLPTTIPADYQWRSGRPALAWRRVL